MNKPLGKPINKKLRVSNTLEDVEQFRELEHFISVRGGKVIEVKSHENSLYVTYEL